MITPQRKAEIIKEAKVQIKKDYGLDVRLFVETGTYYGEMVDMQLDTFDKIITVELSPALYQRAIDKYKDIDKVFLLCGDSIYVMKYMTKYITEPVIFWLDAHYSGNDTVGVENPFPIIPELTSVLSAKLKDAFILIDDYEHIINYVEQIRQLAEKFKYGFELIENTVMRLFPIIEKEQEEETEKTKQE